MSIAHKNGLLTLTSYYYTKSGSPKECNGSRTFFGYYSNNGDDFQPLGDRRESTVYVRNGDYLKNRTVYSGYVSGGKPLYDKVDNKYRYSLVEEQIENKEKVTTTARKDIYLIYTRNKIKPINIQKPTYSKPTTNKTVVRQDDGTYEITLSVTGTAESPDVMDPVNVVVVLDRSSSMKNYNKYKNATNAAKNMAKQLLSINTKEGIADNTVEMAYVAFDGYAEEPLGPTSVYSEFEGYIDTYKETGNGTNWEAALLKANNIRFDDDDPVYIIFISDGDPYDRYSRNGDTNLKHRYGEGRWHSQTGSVEPAKRAAQDIYAANKTIFAVGIGAYGGSVSGDSLTRLKDLLQDKDKNNYYYEVSSNASLVKALNDIAKRIQTTSYTNVKIEDGLTNLTASVDVKGGTGEYKYRIYDENGVLIPETNTDYATDYAKIKKAEYVTDENGENGHVVWDLGSSGNTTEAGYKLRGGHTYSVSFTVWPEQGTFDTLAKLENGDIEESKIPEGFVYDKDEKVWKYLTNTYFSVTGQKVTTANTTAGVKDVLSDPPTEPDIEYYNQGMYLESTTVELEKIWQLENSKQIKLLEGTKSIELKLLTKKLDSKDYDEVNPFKTGIVINNSSSSQNGNVVTWKGSQEVHIAPGILVSEAKGNAHGFDSLVGEGHEDTGVTLIDGYYILEKGHDYKFFETSGNAAFTLKEEVYHPMLVDGKLKNVKLTYDDDGNVTGIPDMTDIGDLTKLTAVNEIKTEKLTVSKTYTGNMASAYETTFELHLFTDQAGTKPATFNTSGYIKNLQGTGSTLTDEGAANGVYKFTITPSTINSEATAEIVLPAGTFYKVVEVKDQKPYNDYKTTWGTESSNISNPTAETGIYKVSDYKFIYFINDMTAVTPTGFGDNANPYVALALAGLAAMVFLAYDFRKRRLFED